MVPSSWSRSTTSTRRSWCRIGWRSASRQRKTHPDATRARASRKRPAATRVRATSKPTSRRPASRPVRRVEMSKELLLVVDAVAAVTCVPESVISESIEAVLASAAMNRYPEEDVLVRVAINPIDANYEAFRRWEVGDDDVVMESPDRQIWMMDAVDESEGAEV